MHRESIYVCTYAFGEDERVGCVLAWDDREAAELFAREIELEPGTAVVPADDVRVRAGVASLVSVELD